ncbi:MAG: type 2 lantipeptide synthetase LanM [Ruminococcus sp.]|nr:type 2 lantipeptide synthetase LanM [Ruminococcus sp.]
MNEYEVIREKLLCKDMLRSLTLDERNLIVSLEERPVINGAVDKYASIPSKANIDKVVKKNQSEGLSECDYYMAFYDFENADINENMKSYIEQQEWFRFLTEALCDFSSVAEEDSDFPDSRYNMAYTTWFLTSCIRKKLIEHIGRLTNITVSAVVIDKILSHAVSGSLHIHCKSVIYDYYINKQNYEGNKKLFRYIQDNFGSVESIIDYYLKYPVILRRLSCKMLNILKYYKKVFTDIDNTYPELCEKGFLRSNVVIDITCGEGDTHENGKTVVMLRFEDDEILYKPRELKITRKFFSFIDALNRRANLYKLPVIKSIWHDSFTIEEKIPYKTCTSETEIKRFYIRTGYLLAILYLLSGNDIHYENIIANGEYPCIIDLETMFAHVAEQMESSGSAIEKTMYSISHSVKSCHMLPSYIFSKGNSKVADVSGLGGKKAKLPDKRLALVNWDSDNICFEMKELYLENHSNIPMLNNERVDYRNYIGNVIEGFDELMREFIKDREFFTDMIKSFSGVKTRQVLRATNDYGYMLEFASHPNYTRDMIYFERFLDAEWVFPYKKPHISRSETLDLLNDDIPIFYCDSDSKDIISSRGECISDVYEESGIEAALSRLAELSEDTINVQKLYIRDTLGILNDWLKAEHEKASDKCRFSIHTTDMDICSLWENKLSDKIIRILRDSAFVGKEDISWAAIKKNRNVLESNAVSNIPVGLLNGLAGIMYYLLDEKNQTASDMVEKIAGSLNKIHDVNELKIPISGTYGFASVLLPVHFYTLSENYSQTTQDICSGIMGWCDNQLDRCENIDYSELASALMMFTALYAKSENYRYLSMMNKAAGVLTSGSRTYINQSSYMVREKICLSLLEANVYLEDEEVTKLIAMIRKLDEPFYNSGCYVQSPLLPDISEYYRLCTLIARENRTDDSLSAEKAVVNSFEYVTGNAEYSPEILMERIDMLLEYQELPNAKELCRKEIERMICISGLIDDDNVYDTLINGISLDSPLCGLGLRIKRWLGITDEKPYFIF